MNKRDLVIEALNHRETERLPYHADFTEQALEKMIAYTGDLDFEKKIGSCIHIFQYWGWPTEIVDRPGYFQDEFGVVWNRNGADKDIGVIESPIIQDISNDRYTFPQTDIKRLRRDIETLVDTKADRFTIMGFGFSMFERAWSLMGMENTLISMLSDADALEHLLDRICAYLEPLVEIALEYEIDAVYFGDDWGQQKGLIMGPEHWRKLIKPRMERLYRKVKQAGKYVIQHSCGDCSEIFPDLIEIGLDCYQTFQPEIYDIQKFKSMYGDQLTIWGGISTQQSLPWLSKEELIQEISAYVKIMRKNGGLILAPTHSLPFDIPEENIMTMLDMFWHQDNYF